MESRTAAGLLYDRVYRGGAGPRDRVPWIDVAHPVAAGKFDTFAFGTVGQMFDWLRPIAGLVGSRDAPLADASGWAWRKAALRTTCKRFLATARRRDWPAFFWLWRCYVPAERQAAFASPTVAVRDQVKEFAAWGSRRLRRRLGSIAIPGREAVAVPLDLIDPGSRDYTEVIRFDVRAGLGPFDLPIVQKVVQYATQGMRDAIAAGDTEGEAVDSRFFPDQAFGGVKCVAVYFVRLGYLRPAYYPEGGRCNESWGTAVMQELFLGLSTRHGCPMRTGVTEADFNSYAAAHPLLLDGLRPRGGR